MVAKQKRWPGAFVASIFSLTLVSAALAHWGVPEPPRGPRDSMYPAARHGGNYMHNYYFPPAPSATPWAPAWSPDGEWIAIFDGRLHLARRPKLRHCGGAHL